MRCLSDLVHLSMEAKKPSHSEQTLARLDGYIKAYKRRVHVFMGARPPNKKNFAFPKFHLVQHFSYFVRQYGALDGLTTNPFESTHITSLKRAFAASSKTGLEEQMLRYVSLREVLRLKRAYLEREGHIKRHADPVLLSDSNERGRAHIGRRPHQQLREPLTLEPDYRSSW
jgi:hypothetical protein